MLAYKFRSSSQIAWALDIVFEERLHCSDWSTLNDPREGFFRYSPAEIDRLEALKRAKRQYKICCLSKYYRSRLLWAHYASGFDGVAVEVELPDCEYNNKFYDVIYDPVLPAVDLHAPRPFDETALSILKHKHSDWSYEDEIRVFELKTWYKLSKPVECIVVGHRFDQALLPALQMVCDRKNITLKRTSVGDEGVVAIEPEP